jgi:hypothetical protein
MLKNITLVIVLIVGLMLSGPVAAQSDPDAHTTYQLNLRAGPGAIYPVVTILAADTGMIFEARNADMSWLLGRTMDGANRGWVASLYLYYRDGFAASRLPLSDEVLAAPAAPAASESPIFEEEAPSAEGLAPSGVAPDLEGLPIVPAISANARAIFQRGQALGNNAHVVTKVGECNSMSWAYLVPFNQGQYELVTYSY